MHRLREGDLMQVELDAARSYEASSDFSALSETDVTKIAGRL